MSRINDPLAFDSKTTKPELARMLTDAKQTILNRNAELHARDAKIEELRATITALHNENNALSTKLKQQIARANRVQRDEQGYTVAELTEASRRYCEQHNVRSVSRDDLVAWLRSQH